MDNSKTVSAKQARAIMAVLSGQNIDKALKEVGVARATFYAWMKQDYFYDQYCNTRKLLVDAAYRLLECNLEKASRVLIGLLDSKDERVQRQAAKDLFEIFGKHIESEELQERIRKLEENNAA